MRKWISFPLIGFVALVASFTAPIETLAHGSHTEGVNYHSHIALTDTYREYDGDMGWCIYGEYIAVDMPEGIDCPPQIAILH